MTLTKTAPSEPISEDQKEATEGRDPVPWVLPEVTASAKEATARQENEPMSLFQETRKSLRIGRDPVPWVLPEASAERR